MSLKLCGVGEAIAILIILAIEKTVAIRVGHDRISLSFRELISID